ncbi:MAG: DNA methyltransferase [Muribaculaceae bacterium]|nr:DNA methyltransferase [Muribaculaceae bacterium]
MTLLKEYITELNRQFSTGLAREHSYRPALQSLLAAILPDMIVINEPARSSCGAPDYIITRRSDNAPVAFVEAKDIDDSDLDGRKNHKEQFERYKLALDRIVFTDYLDFHFYENGEWVENIRLGEIRGDKIYPNEDAFDRFVSLMKRFANSKLQKITSASKLASLMASKARLLASTINNVLEADDDTYASQQIRGQYDAFARVLLHDITHEEFADIYAQTIAYGMFAARMHDKTPEDFSRQEAATLIPKTNPFLRQIFQSIAGYDLDERIAWIVDDLAMTFAATDMPRIMKGYGANSRHSDPMIHFYEDFLTAYNPKLRKAMGVWYTPAPVVSFIVRSVDEILQKEFNLPMGLADYSKISHEVINESYNPKKKGSKRTVTQTFHKVQILDPAVGTGTFLAEVVNRIYDKFENLQGMWQGYVSEHLLPRLNGFELLMAPYAIAHLKLDWLLNETGYEHDTDKRLKVYLTNSLEERHPDLGTLFSMWLSNEANEASRIKRDTPVMVMIGNPPYNGSSSNKGKWIMDLMKSYKTEPGAKEPLNERNPKWLNDDYVKFIRMAQYFIERNGEGVLAFINPHGFLDNPTFRGMRWELMRVFDAIYTLDLHGNTKKNETAPDGSRDQNVFDIRQGVSINFFIKTGKKASDSLGKVYHADLYGLRKDKYKFLEENSWQSISYKKLKPQHPMYFFVPKDMELEHEYNKGFGVNELFPLYSVGIVTTKDAFLVCDTPKEVELRIKDIINLSDQQLRDKYGLKDTRDWSIARAKSDVGCKINKDKITRVNYRWGDDKFLYYTGLTNGIVARPRYHSLSHMLHSRNFALMTVRQLAGKEWTHITLVDSIAESCRLSAKTKEIGYIFPLYLIPGEAGSILEGIKELTPNLNADIVDHLNEKVGQGILSPEEIFDYVYGILHSKDYREKYKEFLKIDFPKVPYPKDAAQFRCFENIGRELRHLHLMQNSASWKIETTYPVSGTNKVESLRYEDGKVFINETQYFGNVPKEAWELFIGGYQPAQKWLKDRKGKELGFEDIRHYQEIIYSLTKTKEIIENIILV